MGLLMHCKPVVLWVLILSLAGCIGQESIEEKNQPDESADYDSYDADTMLIDDQTQSDNESNTDDTSSGSNDDSDTSDGNENDSTQNDETDSDGDGVNDSEDQCPNEDDSVDENNNGEPDCVDNDR